MFLFTIEQGTKWKWKIVALFCLFINVIWYNTFCQGLITHYRHLQLTQREGDSNASDFLCFILSNSYTCKHVLRFNNKMTCWLWNHFLHPFKIVQSSMKKSNFELISRNGAMKNVSFKGEGAYFKKYNDIGNIHKWSNKNLFIVSYVKQNSHDSLFRDIHLSSYYFFLGSFLLILSTINS